MLTVDLSVPGAHCGVCRGVILATLRAVPGVHAAELDLREKRATVLIQPVATDADELCRRLGDAGYPAAPVEADPIAPQGRPNPVG